ncbi:MAG TPA: ABC transporter substrate-binding protein, partial [Methanospirillum sp.]|uniref:ABC transporter substrate-binding protein n=1 Tax=Methanospirillum sp. TaxID=45200 RepID=UPI002C04A2CD
ILLISLLAVSGFAEKTEKTLTDINGHQVTLKVPVDKIVLQDSGSGGPFYTLFALEGNDAIKKIAAIDNGLQDNRADIWNKFVEAVPELKNVPVVGTGKDLNVESVVSLKPDVLIVPKNTYDTAVEVYKKVEEAGIPVVAIDYHAETLANHQKSIELMGELLGKEDRAKELFSDYKAQMDIVNSRLGKITGPKPRVYVECANKNAGELSNSYGNYMWGALIEMCHGDNIAEGAIQTYGPLSQEVILKKDPEVIIYTGSYWPKEAASFRLGFDSTEQKARDTLEPYLKRDGWESLSAMKNNRVYGIYHGLSRDIIDFAAFQYIAKSLYPDEFKDVNPEENLKKFFSKYLPVELSGVWTLDPAK